MKHLAKFLLFAFLPCSSFAQWNTDSTVRNPVCTATGAQYSPRSCSDANGGAIFVWVDERNGGAFNSIYAQRITSKGKTSWANNGIKVLDGVTNNMGIDYGTIVQDGAGGAIVISQVSVTGGTRQLFAQHINSSGGLLWGNGVKLTDGIDSRLNWAGDPEQDGISSDGAGGVFVTWQAYQSPYFIYAQHIDSNGNLVWGSTGVGMPLVGSYDGYRSTIQNTGNGTAVVGFSGPGGGSLYMQRLAADGSYLWGSTGLLVSSNYINQNFEPAHIITYDATNAAILVAFLTEPSATSNIYVQKVDLNGNILWAAGGIKLTNDNAQNLQPDIMPDGKGGLFVCYISNYQTTVQRINTKGKKQWGTNGVVVDNTPSTDQHSPVIVSDAQGGIITVYKTSRNGGGYYSVYTQRYNSSGAPLWRVNGIPVITPYADINHEVNNTVASTKGYAITCWHDSRNAGDNNDIYTARVGGTTGFGFAGPSTSTITENAVLANKNAVIEVKSYPNPASSFVDISFGLVNKETSASIEFYNSNAQKVKQVLLGSLLAGTHKTTINLEKLPAGFYQVVLKLNSQIITTKLEIIK